MRIGRRSARLLYKLVNGVRRLCTTCCAAYTISNPCTQIVCPGVNFPSVWYVTVVPNGSPLDPYVAGVYRTVYDPAFAFWYAPTNPAVCVGGVIQSSASIGCFGSQFVAGYQNQNPTLFCAISPAGLPGITIDCTTFTGSAVQNIFVSGFGFCCADILGADATYAYTITVSP